jgi:protein phosphatase
LLHGDKLQQLTRDHSWVADMVEKGQITPEEARVHPNRSVITRALGSDPNMQPDLYEITASGGDRLLLCSDGLYSMIPDTEIERTLREVREPQNCANALVKAALDAGGTDNVTVIVVAIAGDAPRRERRERFRGRTWMALVLIAVAFVLAAGAVGFYSWVHNSAYLAERDGKVVIYQGIPEDFPGIETHWLYRITDVEVSSLQPSAQAHLREGIRKDNLESAEQLVEEYQRQAHDSPSSVVEGAPDGTGAPGATSSTSVSTSSSQVPSESK